MRFLLPLAICVLVCFGALAEPPEIAASAAVLIEAGSGRILYGVNENERRPMASTTKIMTALLTLENCGLDEIVTASPNASGVPGTSIYLSAGETLTVEQLLYAILLRSGNDAAVALAEYIAGDIDSFAQMMNDEAKRLGADAVFKNPHGLDENGHEASALGMALIAREAMEFPVFRRIVSTKKATIPWPGNEFDRVLTNKNKLLTNYPQATGVKTGFTKKAGRCLVFSAKKGGMEIIGALLGCGNWFNEAGELLDWGFKTYRLKTLVRMGQTAGQIQVAGGMDKRVNAICPKPLMIPVTNDEEATFKIIIEEKLTAPVKTGTVVGFATAYIDGLPVRETPIVVEKGCEKRTFLSSFLKVLRAFNPIP